MINSQCYSIEIRNKLLFFCCWPDDLVQVLCLQFHFLMSKHWKDIVKMLALNICCLIIIRSIQSVQNVVLGSHTKNELVRLLKCTIYSMISNLDLMNI